MRWALYLYRSETFSEDKVETMVEVITREIVRLLRTVWDPTNTGVVDLSGPDRRTPIFLPPASVFGKSVWNERDWLGDLPLSSGVYRGYFLLGPYHESRS